VTVTWHFGQPSLLCPELYAGTYTCDHCERTVGYCMGAYDDMERAAGPVCDDCARHIALGPAIDPLNDPDRRPWAIFSECAVHEDECPDRACVGRRYRYLLAWPTGLDNDRIALWSLANPSKATPYQLDPTVSRCVRRSFSMGFGWTYVVNARGWRETDPKLVPPDPHAIGDRNDAVIRWAARRADLVICGWGHLAGERGSVVLELIRAAGMVPHALRLNADGTPAHPLTRAKMGQPFAIEKAAE
jgi:hypothetical protein